MLKCIIWIYLAQNPKDVHGFKLDLTGPDTGKFTALNRIKILIFFSNSIWTGFAFWMHDHY